MYPYKDQIGNQHRLRDENLAPMPRTEHAVKSIGKSTTRSLSTWIRRLVVLDTLEKSGQADNTYIFFGTDHGLAVSRHGFGKQNMYEHSTRVPFTP